MKLKDLEKIERGAHAVEQSRAAREHAAELQASAQDLPGIRSSGLVKNMSPEEKAQWFDYMRRIVDEAPEIKPKELFPQSPNP